MNQCVKRGAVTIIILLIILLPLNLLPLKQYTEDRLSRFVTLKGRLSSLSTTIKGERFSEENLSAAISLKKPFGEDKLPYSLKFSWFAKFS